MPIPTDTFWNIKRLNVVFALSAILLTLVTVGAIVQDHSAGWRQQQRDARAWESALVDDKIKRELTPQEQKEIQTLREKVADLQKTLETQDKAYEDLVAHRKKLESDKSTLEFKLNNLKSNVQVDEANLQDAIAAEDNERINKLTEQLAGPRKQLREWQEQQFQLAEEIRKTRQDIDTQTAQLDIVKKQYTELTTGLDSLEKKATNLDPARQGGIDGLIGTISSKVRDMPLMGFVNPSERVQQVVLPDVQTDVAFMKITTIDRCTTCHVNIAKKDYTAGNVIAYLEEQVATARKYNLPATPIAGPAAAVPAATAAKPGPVASPDFWHNWTLKLAPDVVRRNNVRIGVLARSVGEGKPATVTYDGQKLAEFKFDLDAKDPNEITKQNDILLALLDAYYQWSKIADVTATRGKAMVTISSQVPEAQINPPRNAGMRYIEELRSGLKAALEAADNGDKWSLLENRYRVGLTDELNVTRRKQGLAALDPSPALLAHPQLELYADVDSPHAMEAVGCTSCHDGSGQETDFVLAAHAPRDVWVDANTGVPILASQLTKPLNEHPEHHDLSSMLDAAEHAHSLHFEHPAASTQPAEVEGHAAQSRPLDYVDPATGKSGKVITQMAYWKKTYEPHAPRDFALVYHEWDWPMRTPEYIQANCARCHSDTYDIKETAPVLYEGKQLFTQLGCVNCHQMDSIPAYENRKVGTDLRHVTAKLSPEYINTWIWAPKAFRPTTKMPHFFMLENNSSDEELRRTRQEARAITEYLVRTATPLPPAHLIPQGAHGSPEAGSALFNTLGCLACHQNLNERAQEWITTDLVKGQGMKPEEA
ncbi:MAG TPA: c-type cytochrome, partial [Tepidisphaeraceae bacterium]